MATVTNWIDHLSASEVAGQVYPMVGSEMLLGTSWYYFSGLRGHFPQLKVKLKSKKS